MRATNQILTRHNFTLEESSTSKYKYEVKSHIQLKERLHSIKIFGEQSYTCQIYNYQRKKSSRTRPKVCYKELLSKYFDGITNPQDWNMQSLRQRQLNLRHLTRSLILLVSPIPHPKRKLFLLISTMYVPPSEIPPSL